MPESRLLGRFLRVSLLCAGIDLCVFFLLTEIYPLRIEWADSPSLAVANIWLARTIAFICASGSAFFLHARFTFHSPVTSKNVARFYTTIFATSLINLGLFVPLLHLLAVLPISLTTARLSAAWVSASVTALMNFYINKVWCFSQK